MQIIDLRDSGKSRYLAITEFNNCFIIRSPSLFFNEYPRHAKRSAFSHKSDRKKGKSVVSFTHEQTIICMQFFVRHVVGSLPMKTEKFASNDNKSLYLQRPQLHAAVLIAHWLT